MGWQDVEGLRLTFVELEPAGTGMVHSYRSPESLVGTWVRAVRTDKSAKGNPQCTGGQGTTAEGACTVYLNLAGPQYPRQRQKYYDVGSFPKMMRIPLEWTLRSKGVARL